jgi:hypothetical protein
VATLAKSRRTVDDFRADVAAKVATKASETAPVSTAAAPLNGATGGEFLPPAGRTDFDKLPAADETETAAAGAEPMTGPGPVIDEASLDVHQRAAVAWKRLEGSETFFDWVAVGEALMHDRRTAMYEAQTNRPKGKGYCAVFSRLLATRPYAKLQESTRTRLLKIMEHEHEVTTWLFKEPQARQLELNHPHSVLRAWRKSLKPKEDNAPKKESPVARLKQELVEVKEENRRMKQDGGGDLWRAEDKAKDIAKVMFSKLTKAKAKAVANALLAMVKEPA